LNTEKARRRSCRNFADFITSWAAIHEDELYAAWNKAVQNIPFGKIEPLR
jgi:hypothetical protein